MGENIETSIAWKLYQNVLIPDAPPHINVVLSKKDIEGLLKKYKPFFIRWTDEWDRKNGEFWYVIKDEKEILEDYSAKIRSEIRRGLRNCRVEKISKEILIKEGFQVYKEAFRRYRYAPKPMSEERFVEYIKNASYCDFWGVYYQDRLIAYAQNYINDNVCNYSTIKLHPDYLKQYPMYALMYNMNMYYLNEKNFLYVSDGARSLNHETSIQDFLIKKFKFRKAYCKLNIAYRSDIRLLVNILYPAKELVYRLADRHSIFKKLTVLLKHEEIRRWYI